MHNRLCRIITLRWRTFSPGARYLSVVLESQDWSHFLRLVKSYIVLKFWSIPIKWSWATAEKLILLTWCIIDYAEYLHMLFTKLLHCAICCRLIEYLQGLSYWSVILRKPRWPIKTVYWVKIGACVCSLGRGICLSTFGMDFKLNP